MQKYVEALEALNNDVENSDADWKFMTDADKDMFMAEWVLDGFEEGRSKNVCSWTLSAVQKVCPRLQLRTAWKVFGRMESFATSSPSARCSASAASGNDCAGPMFVQARAQHHNVAGLCQSLCIREVLNLQLVDVIYESSQLVLCLGQTKSGMEKKVVLQNATVVKWVGQSLVWRRRTTWSHVFHFI